MNDTGRLDPSLIRGLRSMRETTTTFMDSIRQLDAWAEQAADVNRIADADLSAGLDFLREDLRNALDSAQSGSPASIADALSRLLGEASA